MGEDRITTNSMHHQGIKTVGAGLRVSAVAPDGMVEAVELDQAAFVVGVQWHPEVFDFSNTQTKRLFEAFIDAASSQSVTST